MNLINYQVMLPRKSFLLLGFPRTKFCEKCYGDGLSFGKPYSGPTIAKRLPRLIFKSIPYDF